MSKPISAASESALTALFPNSQAREDAATWLVDQLIDAERHRRGAPDASGAFHALALTQGALLKEEFDLSTHGHADGWTIDAVLLDPLEFMRCSIDYGFEVGDQVIAALVSALKVQCPSGKVVRIHTDGFALLLGPTADVTLEKLTLSQIESAVIEQIERVIGTQPGWRPKLTIGALRLTVVDPSHWQVLGPLVWAECERALLVSRRGNKKEMQHRRVVLDGRLPDFG
jgi:GGDEF domain-containing protein